MNLILISEIDFISKNVIQLKERRFNHIKNVLKARPGDTLKIGSINGLMGTGRVTKIDPCHAIVEVDLSTPPPMAIPTTVILALPRPKMTRRIIQNIASIGIKELYFINSFHVEKSYWQSPALKKDKIEEYLINGLEQGIDTILPNVHLRTRFKPFMEDELPEVIKGSTIRLLAHPYDSQPSPQGIKENAVIALGPERGFTSYEVEKFKDQKFAPISLGKRILKVETALTFILGKLCK